MTRVEPALHVGLVDFSEPTLLLIGEPDTFHWLAEQLTARCSFALEGAPGGAHASLRFVPTLQDGRLSRRGDAFEWELSVAEAQLAARQLKELASSERPAHAYLDPTTNSTEVQLVASIGEYDPARVFDESGLRA